MGRLDAGGPVLEGGTLSNGTASPPSPGVGFDALGILPPLLSALSALGYEEATPIQRASIPSLLEGRDLLGIAATGTGKTAAFALPMLQRIVPGAAEPFSTSALVLVPTRELAMQVAEAVHRYGQALGIRCLPLYGGQDIGQQLRALKRGIDVVVATPGRAIDHLGRKTLKLDKVKTVVLDEADEMLDMGFAEDLETLLNATPEGRQTALFSATLPPRIVGIAERPLKDPVRVKIAKEKLAAGAMPRVRQTAYIVPRAYKAATLSRVLDVEAPTSCIIFCRTRTEVDELTVSLNAHGWRAQALHGGMSQEQRDRVLRQFKAHGVELLVATDVAARGLDIEKLTHVVNYDVPNAPEAYVHRIGRTGRAGREGVAITLAEPKESRLLKNIERVTGQRIELATVPTVADLRARRLELLRSSVHEVLIAGELDSFRGVVESLSAEFGALDVAAAAMKLLHQQTQDGAKEEEEQDIPTAAPAPERGERRSGQMRVGEYPGRGPRRPERGTRPDAEGDAAERSGPPGRKGPPETNLVKLFIGAGRKMGMRPADLVGAIAGEAGLPSSRIGAIQIADGYSLVEVPDDAADAVVTALKTATLRGKRVPVRRERG